MSGVRTFFRHCPSCGRRFEIRLVAKKPVDSQSISGSESRPGPAFYGYRAATPAIVQENVPTIVDIEEFRYTYRCKHCGHEWSEVHDTEQTFDAPKGYTGD